MKEWRSLSQQLLISPALMTPVIGNLLSCSSLMLILSSWPNNNKKFNFYVVIMLTVPMFVVLVLNQTWFCRKDTPLFNGDVWKNKDWARNISSWQFEREMAFISVNQRQLVNTFGASYYYFKIVNMKALSDVIYQQFVIFTISGQQSSCYNYVTLGGP